MGLLVGASSAQVTPTPPFIGEASENFSSQAWSTWIECLSDGVFGGAATFCTPGFQSIQLTTFWNNQCPMTHPIGFAGSREGMVEMVFNEPVHRFGGYFGTNSPAKDGTARFYDSANNLLSSNIITFPKNCSWNWNGWETLPGSEIKRIEIEGNFKNGWAMMSDLEISHTANYLKTDTGHVSLGSGGAQNFFINAGAPFAGLPYLVLGSASGTSPGLFLDGHILPLNPDQYFFDILYNPGNLPMVGALGVLDSNGAANASFSIPPGLPVSLLGVSFNHAFLVLQVSPVLYITLTSNPAVVTIGL